LMKKEEALVYLSYRFKTLIGDKILLNQHLTGLKLMQRYHQDWEETS
jgi:hypothetical protein